MWAPGDRQSLALVGCEDELKRALKTARVGEWVHPLTRLAASQAEDSGKTKTGQRSIAVERAEGVDKEHLALVFRKCS